ncbi:MAG TPA: DUF222 domain-containing protein [Streptosporangiaceae bacterium]|nr:DUF222 domain-containing protein [Streptosporangiaceae bacterium]
MKKTRLPIPAGLADMPPGAELAAVLAGIDLSRLGGLDCVTVMRAHHRQVAHEQARLMAAMAEVAVCGIGPDDALPRMDAPDEFSADEIRGALVWTRAAATAQLSLAWDLRSRLPAVFATLERGAIDLPKAKVFSEWTGGLTDSQARQICDALLPGAPQLTTGQLTEQIKRLAIAIDPDWARRRYAEAVRERKVVGYRNDDGSANICGYQLPADRAAAACSHLDALARKIKHAGDGRPIDQIRADLYLGMLDGSYTGWPERDIIAHATATAQEAGPVPFARPPAEHSGDDDCHTHAASPHGPAAATSRSGGQVIHGPWPHVTPHRTGSGHTGRADHGDGSEASRPSAADQVVSPPKERSAAQGRTTTRFSSPDRRTQTPEPAPFDARPGRTERPSHSSEIDGARRFRPVRRQGVEIRVEITTLLGMDDHPGEIAGWGFVDAESARGLVREQTAAEWRFAITDDDGRLLSEGILRRRPDDYPSRAASPCRGGIVELHIKRSDLRQLAARPQRLGGWAKVIVDLLDQARQQEQQEQGDQPFAASPAHSDGRSERHPGGGDERGPRAPGKPMRRRTEIRDRTCTHPRCRTPAHGTDGDHIQEWARGGATRDGNIGSACRHDHRLRHEGGWRVVKLASDRLVWISRLGMHYRVRPPLIIQPLLDPAPREPAPPHQPDGHEDGPIWRDPSALPTEPGRPPPRPDSREPIPF